MKGGKSGIVSAKPAANDGSRTASTYTGRNQRLLIEVLRRRSPLLSLKLADPTFGAKIYPTVG